MARVLPANSPGIEFLRACVREKRRRQQREAARCPRTLIAAAQITRKKDIVRGNSARRPLSSPSRLSPRKFSVADLSHQTRTPPPFPPLCSLSSPLLIGCSASEASVRTGNPAFNWRSRAKRRVPAISTPWPQEERSLRKPRGERRRCQDGSSLRTLESGPASRCCCSAARHDGLHPNCGLILQDRVCSGPVQGRVEGGRGAAVFHRGLLTVVCDIRFHPLPHRGLALDMGMANRSRAGF